MCLVSCDPPPVSYIYALLTPYPHADAIPEFISQRRRWLNGAFFAAVYSLIHFKQIWNTDHTLTRKVLLHIEFVYQFISLLFTFFSLANFYLTFYFVAGSLSDPKIDPFGTTSVYTSLWSSDTPVS